MARIKIKDLPKDMKISKEEMKKVVGGAYNIDDLQKQQQTLQSECTIRPLIFLPPSDEGRLDPTPGRPGMEPIPGR